jgi:hypothetical protein
MEQISRLLEVIMYMRCPQLILTCFGCLILASQAGASIIAAPFTPIEVFEGQSGMIPVTITNTGMVTVSVRYSGLTNGASAPDATDHAGFDDPLLGRGCGPAVPMQSCIVNIGV